MSGSGEIICSKSNITNYSNVSIKILWYESNKGKDQGTPENVGILYIPCRGRFLLVLYA